MCGIIGIVSRPPRRPTPTAADIVGGLDAALDRRGDPGAVAHAAGAVDAALHGLPGVLALADRHDLLAAITARLDQLDAYAGEVDAVLAAPAPDVDDLEAASAASIQLRDALWAIRRDRLRTAHEVAAPAGRDASSAAYSG